MTFYRIATQLAFIGCCLLLIGQGVQAQNYEFAALRGYPQMNTSGWTLAGQAYVGSTPAGDGTPSELILTNATNTTSGAAFFNTPVDISRCQTWVAEFDYRIWGGTGADGIGFFFLARPPRGFVQGGGLGIPTENEGLVVGLDTWQNGNCYGGSVPKLQIRYLSPTINYNECPPGPQQPTIGSVTEIRQPTYNRCMVRYDNGNIDVYLNGVLRLSGFYQINFVGYFGVTASTGGSTDVHSIQNFSLKTFRPILSAPNPGPNITICNGGSGQLGVAPPANDPYTYQWYPATGLDNPNSANPTITLSNNSGAAQTYTYFLTKDTTGSTPRCAFSAAVTVTVLGRAATAGADMTVCSNEPRTLNLNPVNGYTYRWFPSTGLSNPFTANPVLQLRNNTTSPQTYEYIISASNPTLGCNESDTLLVTVLPEAANAGPDLNICSGEPANMGSNPLPNFFFNWSPATGLTNPTASRTNISLQNTTNGVLRYRYVLSAFSTQATCSTNDTVWVNVYPRPVANVGSRNPQVCHGATVRLGAPPAQGISYSWTPAQDLTGANTAQPTVSGVNLTGAPITRWYYLTATSVFGNCVARDSVQVTINPLPAANAGADVAVCVGGTTTLGSTAVPGATYRWLPDSGLNNAATAQPILRGVLNGTTPVVRTYVLEMTQDGCVGRDTVLVTINPLPPVAFAAGTAQVCDKDTLTIPVAAQAGFTYTWQPSPYLIDNIGPGTSPSQRFTANLNVTSPQVMVLVLETRNDVTGCARQDTLLVTVNPKPTDPYQNVQVCAGSTVTVNSRSSLAGWQATWAPSPYLSSLSVVNPVFRAPATILADTMVTLYVNLSNVSYPCTITDSLVVSIIKPPVANAGQDRLELCQGDSVQIGTVGLPGLTYRWSPTTGLNNPALAQPLVSTASALPGVISYVVTVSDGRCEATDTVLVLVKPKPQSLLPNLVTLCSGDTLTVQNPPLVGYTYRWNTSRGLSDSTIANPRITLVANNGLDTLYRFVLAVDNPTTGCSTIDTIGVLVQPKPVANAGADVATCPDQSFTIGSDSVAGMTYSWNPIRGLSNPTNAKPVVTLSDDLSQQIQVVYTVTVTNPGTGCTSKDSVVVTLNPRPTFNLADSLQTCANDSISIGVVAVPGFAYRWSPATGLSNAAVSNPRFALGDAFTGAYTYRLTVTSPEGCERTDSLRLRVLARPAAPNIVGRASFCPGVSGVGFRIANPQFGFAYRWAIVGGTILNTTSRGDSVTVAWGLATTAASIKAITISPNNCVSDTATLPVVLKRQLDVAAPVAVVPASQICLAQGAGVQYRADALLPFSSYVWRTSANGSIVAGQGTAVLTVNWNTAGTGEVWLVETSNTPTDTCLGTSDTLFVNVVPTPVLAGIQAPAQHCVTSGLLTVSTDLLPGATYAWQVTNGQVVNQQGNVVSVQFTSFGPQTISVVPTGANGCVGASVSTLVDVLASPVIAWVSADTVICPSNAGPYRYVAAGADNYRWRVVGGAIASSSADSSAVTITWDLNASGYGISLEGLNTGGCVSGTITLPVRREDVSFTPLVASVVGTPAGSEAVQFSWSQSLGLRPLLLQRRTFGSQTSFATLSELPVGNGTFTDEQVTPGQSIYEYRLLQRTSCGDTLIGPVRGTMRVVAASGTGIDQLTVSLSHALGWQPATYELWRKRDQDTNFELLDSRIADGANAVVFAGLWGQDAFSHCFRVRAISTDGSVESWSNTSCVVVPNRPEAANVVTPNNDGLNDRFILDYLPLYPNHSVRIFNRYGVQVLSAAPYNNQWPGSDVPAGTYFMLLDLGSGAPVKLWVEVMR